MERRHIRSMFGKDKEPEAPKVDKKAEIIAELIQGFASLKEIAETEESENAKQKRTLAVIKSHGSDESDQRMRLYKKNETVDNASKARNKALNDTMIADYARKEKPTPSQKQKIEEIRKKAKEQGI